ncbi:MAG: indolepyruvate ferredoxin oxidoreductase subunit alpha [Spirochaetales bacterium]|nr:indolepyruvate ferredoxin oxidoreductase subunit alpha [Spirochaetales bacterium]
MKQRLMMSGNEAIALGAYEAGVAVGAGYPGTPSTEILESLTGYQGVYTEWSVNEKTALEVGLGTALAGARSLVTMKHVGLNVAADPLFTSVYTGVKGGLVVVNADDPDMHSSQNEQDNRHYARAAKLPMLEPADSEEARRFTSLAFDISERFDTPVILRSTTRISHSRSPVSPSGERRPRADTPRFERNLKKYVMIPAHARARHRAVEERLLALAEYAETFTENRIEPGRGGFGIITSGVAYEYVREVFPDAPILKLGLVWPLPGKLIVRFAAEHETLYVVEELDPFLETEIKAMGIKARGKDFLPRTGEFSPGLLRRAFQAEGKTDASAEGLRSSLRLPPRPPTLCPGCPHRTVFKILGRLGVTVSGDIGCYTLGVLPPFQAMDTCVEMGGSVGLAQGIEIAEGIDGAGETEGAGRTAAVIGDSTFAHSGLTGLVNAAYNGRRILIIVLDNSTTAMTGMQPNPFSGERIDGKPAPAVDYRTLAAAVGLADGDVAIVDAYKPKEVEEAIERFLSARRLSLLVVKGPCIIWKRKRERTTDKRG